jgi:hypothetical protein
MYDILRVEEYLLLHTSCCSYHVWYWLPIHHHTSETDTKYDTVTLEPSQGTVLVNNKVTDSEEEACIAIILSSVCANEKKKKRKKRFWIKNLFRKRARFTHHNLLDELLLTLPADYKNYLRKYHSVGIYMSSNPAPDFLLASSFFNSRLYANRNEFIFIFVLAILASGSFAFKISVNFL